MTISKSSDSFSSLEPLFSDITQPIYSDFIHPVIHYWGKKYPSSSSALIPEKLLPFSLENPAYPLRKYLKRFYRYGEIEDTHLILSVIYINRTYSKLNCDSNLFLQATIMHKLVATTLLLATKYADENCNNLNKIYTEISGISLQELNKLEVTLLELLEYKLYVSGKEFQSTMDSFTFSSETLELLETENHYPEFS